MKHKLINISIIISCIAIFIGLLFISYFVFPFLLPIVPQSSNLEVDKVQNLINCNSTQLTVLQLTDIHLDDEFETPFTFSKIKRLIYKSNPDLIVFTGDLFGDGCSKGGVEQFIDYMEDFKLPWAVVFGNHDNETPYTLPELSNLFENAEYSLFKAGNLANFYGNYYYNINFADNKKFQFIFMDSGQWNFSPDSAKFYDDAVNSAKTLNNGTLVNNFMFYHIPMVGWADAYRAYLNDEVVYSGVLKETNFFNSASTISLYERVKYFGVTKAMICGHHHYNNVKMQHNGISFCQGLKTSISFYNHWSIIGGGTTYTLNSDGSFTYNDVFMI